MEKIINENQQQRKKNLSNIGGILGLFLLITQLLASCTAPKNISEMRYKHDKNKIDTLYNVEFKTPISNPCVSDSKVYSLITNFKPVIYDSCKTKMIAFYAAGCPGKNIVRVRESEIKRITTMANPQEPPQIVKPDLGFTECDSCDRDRSGYLWEIRAVGGIRQNPLNWNKSEYVNYIDTIYKQANFGTGIGGSKIIVGGEVSLVRDFKFLDKMTNTKSAFKLGLLTGVWPMDGSIFVPAAVRLRYTANPISHHDFCNPGSCNSWFFFADAGSPISTNKETKTFGIFGDLGIGMDFNLGHNIDFSIDCGYRWIRTPLPVLKAPPECIQNIDLNPIRISRAFILRFGISL